MSVFIDNYPGGRSIFPDAPGGSVIGPFVSGQNLYVVAQGDANSLENIAVYKSTDGGNTWTGPLDTAHTFKISGGQGYWSALISGGILYIVFFTNPSNITIYTFNTGTDLYGAATFVNEAVAAPDSNGSVGTYQEATFRPGPFVVRSDGSFVTPMIEMEYVGGVFYARTAFDVFTGGTGAPIVTDVLCGKNGLAINDVHCGTILGAGDRTHVFYVDYTNIQLCHRTITSLNAVQTEQTVATPIFNPGGANTQSLIESIGAPAFNSTTGEIAIPYKDVNGNLRVARGISADTPVWTTEQVDATIVLLIHGQATGSQVSAAYYDSNGNLEIVFIENEVPPAVVHIYQTAKLNGVWTAPAQQINTGIASGQFLIQSIHVVEIGGQANLIFYTPDNNNNYILSFATLPDLAPVTPAGPNPIIGPDRLRVFSLPTSCCERELCLPMASNKVFAYH